MARPNITQGTINRLVTSILFAGNPALNITPPFLAPEAIDWAPEGNLTTNLPSMTGHVTSPEPYVMARMTCHLLRSQGFADAWKQQMETSTLLGDATVRPDVNGNILSPYLCNNVAIIGHDRMGFSGRDASFVVVLQGNWQINSNLWP